MKPRDRFKEVGGFNFKYLPSISLMLFFLSLFSPKTNMNKKIDQLHSHMYGQ